MSIAKEFHTWVNEQPWVPGVVNFNIARPQSADPWYVMQVSDAVNESVTLCSKGGEMTLELRAFGSERYNTYEELEALREEIEDNLRYALPNYKVWKVMTTGTVALGTVEESIIEYSCDIVISWEV
ncbi:MAG: hypothetical protein DRI69_01905 [Bacteroidetes bacterium]|nr:MAG: hypothetical protein DRI69_01905 [Bacteroidota bacterium]